MNSPVLPLALSLVVLIAAAGAFFVFWQPQPVAVGGSATLPPLHGDEAAAAALPSDGPPLTEFELTERSGETFDSRAMAGDVWVASFFFTTCPSACVRLNQAMAVLQNDPELGGLRLLSISCDPDTDTPEVLSEYAGRFGADPQRWLFCRGELDYVRQIARDKTQLSVHAKTHSERAVVIDRRGEVRGRFTVTDANQFALCRQLVARCLAEPPTEATERAGDDSPAAREAGDAAPGEEAAEETVTSTAAAEQP